MCLFGLPEAKPQIPQITRKKSTDWCGFAEVNKNTEGTEIHRKHRNFLCFLCAFAFLCVLAFRN